MTMSMTSETSTARCGGCAALLLPGADWCGLCLRPVPAQPVVAADAPFGSSPHLVDGGFRAAAPGPAADLFSESRWRAGSLTFGPVGRVVMTICALLPYPLFIINLPFGLVGVVLWTGLMPRVMRDIWQRDRRHHLPPSG
jgi:hypothetical protein